MARDLAADFEAALEWWREAGVTADFTDAPADWLARAAPPPAELPPAPTPVADVPAAPLLDLSAMPATLDAFAPWWLAEPLLDSGRVSGRVPPRGAAGAALMVIVPEPERDDGAVLLSGPDGRLLDAMLAAMGLAPGDVYLASVLPRHTPMADWDAAAAAGIGEVLARHIDLVRPGRLLCLTGNALPLPENRSPNSGETLRRFNQEGRSIPLFATRSLVALRERPRWKAAFWQAWLDWTRDDG